MKRICLVGVDNYLMLNPAGSDKPVNGEAVQQVLLARAFRDLGFDVSTVVQSYDADIDETIDGIRVLSAYRVHSGVPILRFFHPRASGVFAALRKADADIYFESPAGVLTGITAAFCRWKNRKFVFRVVSDVDCIPGQQLIRFRRDRRLYEYGLHRADLIAVQSRQQQELLAQHYNLESAIVNMAADLPSEGLDRDRDIDVLWISNLNPVKRADRVLAIAGRLKDISFTMIGGMVSGAEQHFEEIKSHAATLSNVRFMGKLPYEETNRHIARAKLFLNTSDVEGFPNTFLQAWMRKVPVVSMFDPDQLILRQRLGAYADSIDGICRHLRELLSDTMRREQIGAAAHEFALENFSPAASARRYVDLCAE